MSCEQRAGVPPAPPAPAQGASPLAPDSRGASQGATAPPARVVDPPDPAAAAPRAYPGLPNVVAYHENFYSGGAPEGGQGLGTLAAMGVRTIISVDGMAPDADAARAHGLRYIHLPIGYNGFDRGRELQLVRAVRDALSQGPVYIHCHHGKHRAAGAAATIAVALGWMTPEQGVARMRVSGTSPAYHGLYACAQQATPLQSAQIDAVPPEFTEASRPQGLVAVMVQVDEVFDHLKDIEAAGWGVPADHPDLVPVAEAGRLADLFRLAHEDPRAIERPADFAARLLADRDRAQALEDQLAAAGAPIAPAAGPGEHAGEAGSVRAALSATLNALGTSCGECHARYRD